MCIRELRNILMKPALNKKRTREGRHRLALFSFIGVVMLLLLFGVAASPDRMALAITTSTGRIAHAIPVQAGDTFSIRFIHSVHRTPVEEFYRVSDHWDIVLERVEYESYGVGNPSGVEAGERFRNEDGKLIVEGMDRRYDAIPIRIGQVIANHELNINGTSTPLSAWSEPGSLVILQLKHVSRWTLWKQ